MEATRGLYVVREHEFSSSAEGIYRVQLNAQHPIFSGHFPQQPVLPGVCQIAIIKELTASHYSIACNQLDIKEVKFLSMITPGDDKALTISISLAEQKLSATITIDGAPATKLKGSVRV